MKRVLPLHPFLFAAYPLLFLYQTNLQEARIDDLVRSLSVVLAAFSLLLLLLWLVCRDVTKAGVITSLCAILFFAYGPLFDAADGLSISGIPLTRNRILFPFWLAITACTSIFLLRSRRNMLELARFFNIAGLVLTAMVLVQLGDGHIGEARQADSSRWNSATALPLDNKLQWTGDGPMPDIYYIVFDSFAREDVLNKYYGYSGRRLTEYLRQKGFYIASGSRSNYNFTYQSLSSSLNMNYLDALAESAGVRSTSIRVYGDMIKDNCVCQQLKAAGYKFVFFPSGFQATDRNAAADIVFSAGKVNLGEFEHTLIRSSVLRAFNFTATAHRKRVDFVFSGLKSVPAIKEPTFAFAHIVCPHSPYVFSADGRYPRQRFLPKECMCQDDYIRLYNGQLEYVTKRAIETIDSILAASSTPPVIVLQSDHGPNFQAGVMHGTAVRRQSDKESAAAWLDIRTGILNAYYFPGDVNKELYQTISPVNTFRLMLNEYFGASYELLPDSNILSAPDE